jgi:DNA-binding response OmpR family regulator
MMVSPRASIALRTDTVRYCCLFVDLPGSVAWLGEHEVQLTCAEFVTLAALTLRAGYTVSRAELEAAIAASGAGHQRASHQHRSVDVLIARLRRKLAGAGCLEIHTARMQGYRLQRRTEPATRPAADRTPARNVR